MNIFYLFIDKATAVKVVSFGGATLDDFGITSMYGLDDTYLKGVKETCNLIDDNTFVEQYFTVLKKQADLMLEYNIGRRG